MAATYLDVPAKEWEEKLRSRDPLERRLGAYALGEIGPEAEESVSTLGDVLGDSESFVRVWAAASLARITPENPAPALSALVQALKDEEYFVRSLAAWHLSRLPHDLPGLEEVVPELKKLEEDPDRNVRVECCAALRRLQTQHHQHQMGCR